MTSQYTPLPVPSAGIPENASHGQDGYDYELRPIHGNEREGCKSFTPSPSAPNMRLSLAEDNGHTHYHNETIADPTSKTPEAFATLLMSQHDCSSKTYSSGERTPAVRSTIVSWLPELIAVMVSVGSLVAIVAVLRREDGKPLSEWSLAVTLNTVIATLGTLARTTLAFALSACIGQQKWNWLRVRSDHLVAWTRFDEASRGPWGATRLFFWLRARHWAALGALVIIGTVAFDPFLQAVLTTDGRLDDDHLAEHEARLPQALLVDAGTIVEVPSVGMRRANTSAGVLAIEGGFTIQPDFGMISAIYNGFHNNTLRDPITSENRAEQVVNGVCTTGNCTWPPFTSAAICSACNDLSAQISMGQGLGTGGSSIPGPTNVMAISNYTAFTLRNANLSNADNAKYEPTSGSKSTVSDVTLLTANTTFDARETTSFQDLPTLIASFVVMKASSNWLEGKVAWNASRPTATECALYFCANIYNAESRNGKLVETVQRSWSNRNSSSYQADPRSRTVNVTRYRAAIDAYMAEQGSMLYDPLIQRTDLQLSIPKEESPDVISFTRSFNITYAFIMSMTDFLRTFTAGTEDIGQMAYPAWKDGMSPLANALWESDNLTQTFDHVATSLTNQVRNTAMYTRNYHEASGDTLKWVIHVRVQWPYLAFPIAMIILGIVYILLTIVESTRLHVPVWKEAALPSLLHGLDNETQSLLREAQSQVKGPGAGATFVRFGPDERDDCLRLVAEKDVVRRAHEA